MKRIIFCLAMMAPVALFAQSATNSNQATRSNMESTRADAKATFANKIEELNATLSRNNNEHAQKVMNDLMATMQRYISLEAGNVAEGKEAATKVKIDKLNNVYGELKMMSVDPAKNQKGIQNKVDEFIKLM